MKFELFFFVDFGVKIKYLWGVLLYFKIFDFRIKYINFFFGLMINLKYVC